MAILESYGKEVNSIFQLLGDKENDITLSIRCGAISKMALRQASTLFQCRNAQRNMLICICLFSHPVILTESPFRTYPMLRYII